MSNKWFTEENAKSAWDTGTSTLSSVWDGISGWAGRNPGVAKGIGMFFGGILALNLMENMQWKFWIPTMLAALLTLDVGTSAWTDHAEKQEKARQAGADIPVAEKARRFEAAQARLEGRTYDTSGGHSASSGSSGRNPDTETAPTTTIPGFAP